MRRLILACIIIFATAHMAVAQVQITNVRDTMFTVSWVSTEAEIGKIHYGTSSLNLDAIVYDARGKDISSSLHYIECRKLLPDTTYYFSVVSGETIDDNNGRLYSVKTGPVLSELPASMVAYGQILQADGVTPAEAIVYVTVQDHDGYGNSGISAPMAVLVNQESYWSANLGNLRTADLQNEFIYSTSGDKLELTIVEQDGTTRTQTIDTQNLNPAPVIELTDFVVKKAGNGEGTVWAGEQKCNPDCQEMRVPYTDRTAVVFNAVPAEDSEFVQWERENGEILAEAQIHVQRGDVIIAVFEKK